MIPEKKQAAVKQALQLTFGTSEFEDIRQLTVGLSSALIFRIVVQSKPYLLRVITRDDAMGDPAHYYTCMKPGAEAGLAPHIWYAGIGDRISITDFVEAKPFPINKARVVLPEILKRLHALPPFPFRVHYFDAIDGFIKTFREAKILPESMTAEMFQQYERIKAVYPRNTSDWVSCHNDLKPENMLFDGNKAWLVDWEAAFLNDRYLDLTVVANFAATKDGEEKKYLQTYFGKEPTEYQRARFFLMQQYLHIAYVCVFMKLGVTADKPVDLLSAKPGFREFNDDMWAGKIDLAFSEAKQLYAWAHLEQLTNNLHKKRYEESLKIVADHHAS